MPVPDSASPKLSIKDKRIVVVLNRASGSWTSTCEREVEHLLHEADLTDATVLGSAPSGSGRDHTISNGSDIFASLNTPSRNVKAERVYSAESLDFFRDLNFG